MEIDEEQENRDGDQCLLGTVVTCCEAGSYARSRICRTHAILFDAFARVRTSYRNEAAGRRLALTRLVAVRTLVSQHPRVELLVVFLVVRPALLCAEKLVFRGVDALVVALRALRLAALLARNDALAPRPVRDRHYTCAPRASSAVPAFPRVTGRLSSTGAKALAAEVEILARVANFVRPRLAMRAIWALLAQAPSAQDLAALILDVPQHHSGKAKPPPVIMLVRLGSERLGAPRGRQTRQDPC